MDIYFAPIQGFTDAAYRRAHAAVCGGVAAYGVPFVRVENGEVRKKDIRDISANLPLLMQGLRNVEENNDSGRKNISFCEIPQVIARDAEEFRIAVAAICRTYEEKGVAPQVIDINMGCPFPPQVNKGRGAGLLQHPDKLEEILRVAKAMHDEHGLRFSAKMRLGQTTVDEGLAAMRLLNEVSLERVTIHARLGKQQYKGETDEAAFAALAATCVHPVIYNGDICSVADICGIESRFPALKGVMIGRGLLARPTLAAEYYANKRGGAPLTDEKVCEVAPLTEDEMREVVPLKEEKVYEIASLTDDEVRDAVLRIHRQVLDDYMKMLEGGDTQVLQKILPLWEYLEPLFGHKTVKALRKAKNLSEYKGIVHSLGCEPNKG